MSITLVFALATFKQSVHCYTGGQIATGCDVTPENVIAFLNSYVELVN